MPLALDDPRLRDFWTPRQLATLTTLRPDGSPHTVPVAPLLDPDAGVIRILTSRRSRKVAHILSGSARVSVCQVDGRTWTTLEGLASVHDDPDTVADAERRYALRFRTPRVNPDRVILVITVDRIMGYLG